MTPEERAGHVRLTGIAGEVRTRIAAAIRDAVKADRAAAAKIAASHFAYRHDAELTLAGNLIANAIRERPL